MELKQILQIIPKNRFPTLACSKSTQIEMKTES